MGRMNSYFFSSLMEMDMPSPIPFRSLDCCDAGTWVCGASVHIISVWCTKICLTMNCVHDGLLRRIFYCPFPSPKRVIVNMVGDHFGVTKHSSRVFILLGGIANPWGIRSCNNYALTVYFPNRAQSYCSWYDACPFLRHFLFGPRIYDPRNSLVRIYEIRNILPLLIRYQFEPGSHD